MDQVAVHHACATVVTCELVEDPLQKIPVVGLYRRMTRACSTPTVLAYAAGFTFAGEALRMNSKLIRLELHCNLKFLVECAQDKR